MGGGSDRGTVTGNRIDVRERVHAADAEEHRVM